MKKRVIYYIDDSNSDIVMATEMMDEYLVISHDADPQTWKDFVARHGQYANNPKPEVIVIDANLDRMSGFEVAQYVNDHDLCEKVVVCSGTDAESQKVLQSRSYEVDITTFMVKPVNNAKIEVVFEREPGCRMNRMK